MHGRVQTDRLAGSAGDFFVEGDHHFVLHVAVEGRGQGDRGRSFPIAERRIGNHGAHEPGVEILDRIPHEEVAAFVAAGGGPGVVVVVVHVPQDLVEAVMHCIAGYVVGEVEVPFIGHHVQVVGQSVAVGLHQVIVPFVFADQAVDLGRLAGPGRRQHAVRIARVDQVGPERRGGGTGVPTLYEAAVLVARVNDKADGIARCTVYFAQGEIDARFELRIAFGGEGGRAGHCGGGMQTAGSAGRERLITVDHAAGVIIHVVTTFVGIAAIGRIGAVVVIIEINAHAVAVFERVVPLHVIGKVKILVVGLEIDGKRIRAFHFERVGVGPFGRVDRAVDGDIHGFPICGNRIRAGGTHAKNQSGDHHAPYPQAHAKPPCIVSNVSPCVTSSTNRQWNSYFNIRL